MLAVLAGCASPIPGARAQRAQPAAAAIPAPLPWHHEFDPPASAEQVRGRIISIIDGDTFEISVSTDNQPPSTYERAGDITETSQSVTVRLLGIDTPEKLGGPRPAECFGAEATAFATALVPVGTGVWLSRDRETRDQYGRLLAWIHRDDGVLVNLAMVESGHAEALFFAPNDDLAPLFEQAAWTARRLQRGFWPACGGADSVIAATPSD